MIALVNIHEATKAEEALAKANENMERELPAANIQMIPQTVGWTDQEIANFNSLMIAFPFVKCAMKYQETLGLVTAEDICNKLEKKVQKQYLNHCENLQIDDFNFQWVIQIHIWAITFIFYAVSQCRNYCCY